MNVLWIQAQLYWYLIREAMNKDDYFKDFKLANYRFIVVSNKTRTPLVWEFPLTEAITDIQIGEHTLKNWRGIVTELNTYLTENSSVPKGIIKVGINNIKEWLEHE